MKNKMALDDTFITHELQCMPWLYFTILRAYLKKNPQSAQSAVCMVCVLTWLTLVWCTSVNQAINDKKVSLQCKIHLEYMYIQVVL